MLSMGVSLPFFVTIVSPTAVGETIEKSWVFVCSAPLGPEKQGLTE